MQERKTIPQKREAFLCDNQEPETECFGAVLEKIEELKDSDLLEEAEQLEQEFEDFGVEVRQIMIDYLEQMLVEHLDSLYDYKGEKKEEVDQFIKDEDIYRLALNTDDLNPILKGMVQFARQSLNDCLIGSVFQNQSQAELWFRRLIDLGKARKRIEQKDIRFIICMSMIHEIKSIPNYNSEYGVVGGKEGKSPLQILSQASDKMLSETLGLPNLCQLF